jgi:hypothetical protein
MATYPNMKECEEDIDLLANWLYEQTDSEDDPDEVWIIETYAQWLDDNGIENTRDDGGPTEAVFDPVNLDGFVKGFKGNAPLAPMDVEAMLAEMFGGNLHFDDEDEDE